jgi:ABC-2 type transport system ATP-binding protein
LIRAEHLSKTFGRLRAVSDVSFTVSPGEVVGFLGPNGAGKTTTLRMLAGVFPPSGGRATIGGHDVVADPTRARRHLGYFPERIALYGDMAVRAYLRHVAALKGVAAPTRRTAVDSAMARSGVTTVAGARIGTLSKGFRQRVGLAQVLIGDPQALLLDEPTSGLDPEQVADMRALVRELGRTCAVLLSSHVLAEVQLTCDRVIILSQGRVVAEDTPDALAARLRTQSAVTLEVEGPADAVTRAVESVDGVRSVQPLPGPTGRTVRIRVETGKDTDLRRELVRAVVGAGLTLVEIQSEPLSLEETFLTLVGQREHEQRQPEHQLPGP